MKRWVPVLLVLFAALVSQTLGYAPESRLGGMVLAECSFDPVWNLADASGYSFCGGDPLNRFDADGRLAKQAANLAYHGGLRGYGVRQLASYLEGYETDSARLGYYTACCGALLNELAAVGAPCSVVNGLIGFGNNISTIYSQSGFVPAASYAISGWNVGKIYSGLANLDLVTGEPVGDWYERGTVISSGVASTAGIAAAGLGVYNWATAAPASAPPVITTAPRTTFFVTPEGQAIPNIAAAEAPVVTIVEPISLMRFAPTAARAEIRVGSYATTASEGAYLQTPQQIVSRLGLYEPSHPPPGANFFSRSEVIPAGSQVQIGTVQPVTLPQGSWIFPRGTTLQGGAPEVILRQRGGGN